ncbi:hypothetical protein TCAL_04259 [Tigriopus californicus]|uniref:DUF7027 domain-containing protein n=1 Tax=Tigriopus californicus TaxID=6832 RepID=A0A553PMG4_TIGCA|nr:uncharacterized protein LOC131890887 [Tigriopus californicus]TRY78877.1 hypothetical protein TCAL_04259 [Tigriopus californicus]|eukprot:TCALIF_04259-PA protein Name:"Protein of unknown function" AED:0.22 eAED:0.17 QI:0/1/0.33/1/0.5/1/3/357/439
MSSSQVPLLHKQNQHPPISDTGSVHLQQQPHQHHQQRRTSMANLRRHRSTKRYASRRLSRRRPSSRRTSRLPSDDLEELALMQQASSGQDGTFDCIHIFPIRPHGLFVAAMGVILSIVGLVATSTLLLRNAVLVELGSLPPGCTGFVQNITANASGSSLTFPANASSIYVHALRNRGDRGERPSLLHKPYPAPRLSVQTSIQDTIVKVARSEPPQDTNCSAYATFIYLLGHGLQGSSRFDSNLGPVSTYFFVNSQMLWCGFVVSIVFLWSSISLWSGIWHFRRRSLVPWLLVSGITILFLIMSTVWFLICNRGWFKLLSLVPAGLGLLFLYWWLLINDLLEEIHEDKKAEAAVIADGLVLTTSAAAALIPNAAVSSVHQYDPQETIQTNGHVNEGVVQLTEGTPHLLPGANGHAGSRDRTSLPTVDEISPQHKRELTLV